MAETFEVSVIIPSYNSEHTIFRCLSALSRQKCRFSYEIILVDSSVDRTPEIVRQHFPGVDYLHLEKKTDPGTARNLGVQRSRGRYILFIDSDCIAPPDWIQRYVDLHHRMPEVAGIGGSVVNGNPPEDPIGWAGYMAEFREYIPEQPAAFVPHLPTLNLSYKRWVFDKYGYFDPHFYPQEDLVFNFHLVQQGEKIYFEPSITVKHLHRSNLQAFLKHQVRIGRITSQVLKQIPLSGATIVRRKWLFIIMGPLLPVVKFFRTVKVFLQRNPTILRRHPMAMVILKIGLLYWFWGFTCGVFSEWGESP